METLEYTEKRTGLGIVRGIVVAAAAVAALVVTCSMLWNMVFLAGSGNKAPGVPENWTVLDRFDDYIARAAADSLADVEPIRWIYTLKDEDLIAPEPNPACYGTSGDPSTLQWLLDEADRMLDVGTTIFTTETQIMMGSQVTYYLDDSIFVVTWKQIVNRSVYTMSEVKVAHASQFRRYVSDGVYGSESTYYPSTMAQTVNAVTAANGDFYNFRSWGVNVYMGQVRNVKTIVDSCYIDDNGDLLFTRAGELQTVEEAQAFVDEHNVRFSLAFGPVMVENGENVVPSQYVLGEINDKYARAALCQVDTLHYLLVAANQEGNYKGLVTSSGFADELVKLGVQKAFALDGGQTAAIITNDKLINRPVYGYQRHMSDIIYFATAIPEERWMEE